MVKNFLDLEGSHHKESGKFIFKGPPFYINLQNLFQL